MSDKVTQSEEPHKEESKATQQSNEEKKGDEVDYWQEFQLGLRSVIMTWSAVQMAVEHGWGGRNSKEKVEVLINEILELLDTKPDIDKLLDLIEDFLPQNFSVIIEDESTDQVANDIWDIFCTCAEGDNTLARKCFNELPEEKRTSIKASLGIEVPPVPQLVAGDKKKKKKKPKKPKMSLPNDENNGGEDDDGWQVVE